MIQHTVASKPKRRGIQVKADIGETNLPGTPSPISSLQVSRLILDPAIQQRAAMNDELVAEYASNIVEWIDSAPIDVFTDTRDRWVADGFHRVEAARRAGLDAIPARQHPGTRRDALLFAISANHGHGLRRTNADKRRAVETLLADPEWSTWSDRMIADRAGVSPSTVGSLRLQLSKLDSSSEQTKRLGADGKERAIPPRKPAPEEVIVEALEGDDLDGIRSTTAKIQALHGSTARPDSAPATAPPKPPTPKDAMHAAHGVTAALGLLRKVEAALIEEDARVLIDELRKALDRLTARFPAPEGGRGDA